MRTGDGVFLKHFSLSRRESNTMWFFNANFHRCCVKKDSQCVSITRLFDLPRQKFVIKKTASHLKSLFFRAVWCFLGEAILSYSETKSAAMCGETGFLGTWGSIPFCLRIIGFKAFDMLLQNNVNILRERAVVIFRLLFNFSQNIAVNGNAYLFL